MSKMDLQIKAIHLRSSGLSYSEILKQVPVAKSTLSLWLRKVDLSISQKQQLTQKRLQAALKGALKKKEQRTILSEQIKRESLKELGVLDKNIFWLVGAALYWAEGNKQKECNISQGVKFSNSDPLMVKFFYKWLTNICKIKRKDIIFELYIHKGCAINNIKKFWANILRIDINNFNRVRFKPNKFYSYRKNKGENYYGLIRINVLKSTNFNRRISGWICGLCEQYGIS